MSTMSKFIKRITKLLKNPETVLVIGKGFGMTKELTEIIHPVVVVDSCAPDLTAKNFVFRQDFGDIGEIGNPSAIMVDLDRLHELNNAVSLWAKSRPYILIEGNDLVDREKTKLLWMHHYRPIEQLGLFHAWKMMQ
jgi:hypothetical protein